MEFELNKAKTELKIDFKNLRAVVKSKSQVRLLIMQLKDYVEQMKDHPSEK